MAEATIEKAPEELKKTDEKPANKSLDEDAFHNFLQGKRHILVKDYPHAVQSLAKACELYAEHYGPLANECGDVFFLYGKALFNLYQEQAGVFGDTVPEGSEEEEEEEEREGDSDEEKEKGSNDDEEDESKDEGNQENEDKEDDSESVSSSKDGEKTDSMDASKPMSEESEIKDNDISSNVNDSSAEPSASTTEPQEENQACELNSHEDVDQSLANAGPSTSQSKPQKSEDDISDLQLAWETLEMAKTIFQKQGTEAEDAQLKVAEILLILGEISLECDNYQAAIKDFQEGLSIWHHRLPSDDRRIAEAFYQLGRAYQLDNQSDKAIEFYEKTIELIQMRINILKSQTEIKQNADGFDIDPNVEIQELEALIPDLKVKMEDAQELDKETKKAIQETLHKMEEVTVTSTSDEKPVTNISHLLKRKKPDDQESSKGGEAKKMKLSNSSSPSRNIEEQVQSTSEATPPPQT